MRSRPLVFSLVLVATLALAGAAVAEQPQVRLTTAGNAAARAAVVRRADLGPTPGWSGGAKKPDLSSTPDCAGFAPKQSDLVVVGAAATAWKHGALEFDSQAEVMQTPRMVRLDWQRSVASPRLLGCMRQEMAKQSTAAVKFVSIRKRALPRVGDSSTALEIRTSYTESGRTVALVSDILLVGKGRTEITLTTTSAYAARATVRPAELRLARLLAARARS